MAFIKMKIIYILIAFIALFLIVGSYMKYRPDLKLIDYIVENREKEILKEKNDKIIELNGKIELIKAQLSESQKRYNNLKKKLSALEQQEHNINRRVA
jgi:chromosome segregation ATPase